MYHFIYAMNSTDPAPASGGDTKSWFEYYKWDIDDFAYVPVTEEDVLGCDFFGANTTGNVTLWFAMDQRLLGCVPVHAFMPALSGGSELHYDTRLMQVAPDDVILQTAELTGLAADQNAYQELKRLFDAQYPPRDQALAASLDLIQSK